MRDFAARQNRASPALRSSTTRPSSTSFARCCRVMGAHAWWSTSHGTDAPYVFVDLKGASSWDMFSKILEEAQVVTIPGAGFGPGGEGFLRLSAFAPREACIEACERLRTAMKP